MGIILGILVLIVAAVAAALVQFANGMASAPSARARIAVWPVIVIGTVTSLLLIISHFVGW